jgi:DNA-binding response OmpR family regulator
LPVSSIILLLDSEETILSLAKKALEDHGYTALTTSSTEEALQLIETYRPDVIVMEIRLFDVDGVDLLNLLGERYEDTPVVIHTASHVTSHVRSLADGYVVKSDDLAELKSTIQSVLRRRSRSPYQGPERRSGKERRVEERRQKEGRKRERRSSKTPVHRQIILARRSMEERRQTERRRGERRQAERRRELR